MEKKKIGIIILFIILLLLAIQVLQPGIVDSKSFSSWVKNGWWGLFFGTLFFNFGLGVLFIALAILVILNKKGVRIPLIIILGLFTIYSVYYIVKYIVFKEQIINSLSYIYGVQVARKQIMIGIIQSIEYSILSITGTILAWFHLKKSKK